MSQISKEEFLDVINKGFQTWNNYKKKLGKVIIDLSGLNLSKKDLRNYDFSKSVLYINF